MKKNIKIFLCVLLVVVFALMLVGCGKVTHDVDGVYYATSKDQATLDVIVVNGEDVTTYKFDLDGAGDQNVEDLLLDVKNNPNKYQDKAKVGTCTFENNAFIINRLDIKYNDGGSTYCYLNLDNGTFKFSPKMSTILLYAVIGFSVTLVVLCVLMGVIKLLGFSVDKVSAKVAQKTKEQTQSTEQSEQSTQPVVLAKGSAGDLKLQGVSERDAAMIMAIVADELQEPLNTLRFISIKDVTDQSK